MEQHFEQRLKEIEQHVNYKAKTTPISEGVLYIGDAKWLIEQAKKVEGLEAQADDMAEKHAEKDIMVHRQAIEIIKYRDECIKAYEKYSKFKNNSMMDINLGALQAIQKVMNIIGAAGQINLED